MADWSILQPMPNFVQAALGGYQAGQQIRKQQQMDAALQNVDLTRPESLLPLLRADPSSGAALIGAAVKLHAEDRAAQGNVALGRAAAGLFGGAGGGASPALQANQPAASAAGSGPITASPTPANPLAAVGGVPSAPAGATDGSDGITVVGQQPHPVTQMAPNLQQVVARLMSTGNVSLDQAAQFVDLASKMNKAQADALSDQQQALSDVASAIPQTASLAERQAFVLGHKDYLLSHNVPEAKIDSFVPTNENIASIQTMALGTKEALAAARANASQAETRRHNGVEEGQGQQRIGLEAQNVGISAGHLALDRQKEAREAKAAGAGSGGAIATPASKAEYDALPKGARYYRNGQVFIKGAGQ